MVAAKTRTKIADTFMELLAERSWDEVSMGDVSQAADVPLKTLRSAYASRLDILGDVFGRIDEQVLGQIDDDLQEEPPRDRLFDILMTRLEVMAPYKPAMRNLAHDVRRNPALAAGLHSLARKSADWMLTAAGIRTTGLRGTARTQGLVIAFARVLRVWIDDDDPGLARTMKALDTELKRGETVLSRLDRAGSFFASLRGYRPAGA